MTGYYVGAARCTVVFRGKRRHLGDRAPAPPRGLSWRFGRLLMARALNRYWPGQSDF